MSTLIASPQQRISISVDPTVMAGTDPYGLGFPVFDYVVGGDREVAVYELGGAVTAYLSYNLRFGHAVVIQNGFGQELYAGRSASEEESRSIVTRYLS